MDDRSIAFCIGVFLIGSLLAVAIVAAYQNIPVR
jgi:hypothetical protein